MRISFLILTLLPIIGFGQEDRSGTKSYKYQPSLGNGVFREDSKAKEINGSPYIISSFSLVKVASIEEKTKMRYNVYKDEFEFITAKNDTLILDKLEDFSDLNFVATNTKYKLVNYLNINDKLQLGYLIEMHQKNDFGLFKKENINLNEEKIAKTSLEQNMPAKYYKSEDFYFLKSKDKIVEFPSNKKRLSKIFPEKKEAIETFVKENKIDFNKETDKIKLIDFLSTI